MGIRSLGWMLSCAALAAVGCSESHATGDEDASIVIDLDGAMLDAGPPDGGPLVVGTACTSDAECGVDGVCLADPEFLPGGYCSLSCDPAAAAPCPAGATCVTIGMGQSFCFQSCEPGATPRQCRAGYGCGSLGPGGGGAICLGGCSDDSDCPSGLMCDPSGGFTGAGSCYSPGSAVGDACQTLEDCPMGGFCLDEAGNGWPGGSCITFDCDPTSNTGCPGDAQCIPNGMTALCIDGCATDADCRAGYTCAGSAAFPDRLICQPGCTADTQCAVSGNVCNAALGTCAVPFDPSLLGAQCSRFRGGCEGGSCLSEGETGFPGAYCAYVGCTVGDDSTCPTGGVCAPGRGGDNLCLDGCAADTDCRAGYACRHVVPTDDTSATACMPACTDDSQCSTRLMNTCNVGTGLCGPRFDPDRQGEPCESVAECQGGRCLTEADGWPAGMCVLVGCSLMSGTTGEECPSGSTCVDDMQGRPEIGYCLDACTVGGAPCRTGYTCEALSGGTDGVCRPTSPMP